MSDLSIKEGLSYLFGEVNNEKNDINSEKLLYLPISKIFSSENQPRKNFSENELNELAQSIKEHGILQPILVRPKGDDYEIIAGDRRYRASKICDLEKIPCLIENISDETASVYALIENIQRKNLNIIEEAEGFNRLIDIHGFSHDEAAQYVGKSRSYITNTMRLLKLHEKVRKMLSDNLLPMGQGRALLPLSDEKQLEAAQLIVSQELNTRQTEALVKRMLFDSNRFPNDILKPIFLEDYSARITNHLDSKFKISKHGDQFKISGVFESEYDFKKFLSLLGLN